MACLEIICVSRHSISRSLKIAIFDFDRSRTNSVGVSQYGLMAFEIKRDFGSKIAIFSYPTCSGVFRNSVRRGRGAVGVEGVVCGGEGWAPTQNNFCVFKMISSGAF